jgi:hypothetical protein
MVFVLLVWYLPTGATRFDMGYPKALYNPMLPKKAAYGKISRNETAQIVFRGAGFSATVAV